MKLMKAYGHLKPGQKGTQRFFAEFERPLSVSSNGMTSEPETM